MKKLALMALLLGLLASGATGYSWYRVHEPYQGYSDETIVDIPPGLGSVEIVDLLIARGVVQYRYPSLAYLYVSGFRGRLQTGEYVFDGPLSASAVFARLARGDVRLYTFTVPEGLRLDQIANRWEESGFGDRASFLEAAEAALPKVREIDPAAVSVEGYLFPETYSFPRAVTAEDAIQAMTRGLRDALVRLQEEVNPDLWPLDLNRMLILASLIESEAAVEEERVLVSSVFLNRLERGMRLECDPTVIYALMLDDNYRGRLLREDLSYDSPYNTYVHGGLPPGPIANPGYLSMLAAVRPAETDYIFFVRTEGSRHVFSRTLTEHNRAVAAYRRSQ